MDENNKDNINSNEETNENTKVDENQSQGESSYTENNSSATSNENQEEIQPKIEENNNHEVIHKKEGRLHIYVRQDKYKGELKSKNFVGRIYIDGKQKISSSGTPNLEEAIPILEKWFDDIHAENKKEEQVHQETKEDHRCGGVHGKPHEQHGHRPQGNHREAQAGEDRPRSQQRRRQGETRESE